MCPFLCVFVLCECGEMEYTLIKHKLVILDELVKYQCSYDTNIMGKSIKVVYNMLIASNETWFKCCACVM